MSDYDDYLEELKKAGNSESVDRVAKEILEELQTLNMDLVQWFSGIGRQIRNLLELDSLKAKAAKKVMKAFAKQPLGKLRFKIFEIEEIAGQNDLSSKVKRLIDYARNEMTLQEADEIFAQLADLESSGAILGDDAALLGKQCHVAVEGFATPPARDSSKATIIGFLESITRFRFVAQEQFPAVECLVRQFDVDFSNIESVHVNDRACWCGWEFFNVFPNLHCIELASGSLTERVQDFGGIGSLRSVNRIVAPFLSAYRSSGFVERLIKENPHVTIVELQQ